MKCPECGCEDIAISVTYRKSTLCRVIRFIILICLCYTIIFNMAEIITFQELNSTPSVSIAATQIELAMVTEDNIPGGTFQPITPTIGVLLSLTIALIFFEILRFWIESKARIYYVCKSCGKFWHENQPIE